MVRSWRSDGQGAWHHVMNRGLADRSVFKGRECVRYFLFCLARVVRRGLVEVQRGPRWLERDWVEGDAVTCVGASQFTYELYRIACGAPLDAAVSKLVEARLYSTPALPIRWTS